MKHLINLLILMGLGCAHPTIQAERVVTEQLILTDAAGRPRVFVGVDQDAAGLVIYDTDGNARAGLNLIGHEAELTLTDAQGTVGAILIHDGQRARLTLFDGDGQGTFTAPPPDGSAQTPPGNGLSDLDQRGLRQDAEAGHSER